MVTLAELTALQNDAANACKGYGYTYDVLDQNELSAFLASFQRQFILTTPAREIIDLYNRHATEILMGAMIAKKQMSSNIDGEQPGSGKIGGPLMIRAAWLGVGQDWDDISTITCGSAQNWIHSGTTLMGGTSGNAVKIGTNQVTVAIAMGSFHPSPKIESVAFTIDGKPKPVLILQNIRKAVMPSIGFPFKEFDNAYIFKKDNTVLAKIIITSGIVSTALDIPYLLGASFIKEDQLRVQLATSIPGTTPDVIKTT